jgi:small subunit ribosomal protein S20
MPNHKSAKKRVRQTAKKTAVNKSNKSSLRTQIKKLRTALASQDKEQSQELLNPTIALIDKSVNKGVLHKNTAARHKSRLTSHVNNLSK